MTGTRPRLPIAFLPLVRIAIVAVAFGAPLIFQAQTWASVTVTIQPSTADTYVSQASPTTNYGGLTTTQVASQSGSRNKRTIVKFDLSQIPAGATITSATLRLFMTTAPNASRTYQAYRITQDWTESGATWTRATSSVNWTTAGGTIAGAATGQTATGTTGNTTLSWTITADVQAWVNGSAVNYGTLIKDQTESSTTAYTATFASNANGTPANTPALVVTYTDTYTLWLPGGSSVVMGDTSPLNFTVTNADLAPGTTRLSWVRLTFPTGYTIPSGVAPPGWVVYQISGNQITFRPDQQSGAACDAEALAPGTAAVLGVNVTAPAQASESTDALSSTQGLYDCSAFWPGGWGATSFAQGGASPSWTRRGLEATLSATPGTIGTGGAISVSMTVTNRTTGVQNAVAPSALTTSGSGSATMTSGPSPASANLAAGASQTFTWTYQAASVGDVTFSGTASNGTVQSVGASSNAVQIGNLTTALSVSPTGTTSGNQVTVTMTVTNNGNSTLSTIVPSALVAGGSATSVLVSGPTPASIASLAPGGSTSFSWTYTVSGSNGGTYQYTGSAAAQGGLTSNSATSDTGTLGAVSASASPSAIPAGSAATITYAVNNQTGRAIRQVAIVAPAGFTYGSGTPPGGWTVSASGSTVTFASGGSGSDIADGSSNSFVVAWTAVPATPNTYTFTVNTTTRGGFIPLTFSTSASVTVNQYTLTLSPSPSAIAGDGSSTSTLTATLTSGGSGVYPATVSFGTSLGTLSAITAATNASGQATVSLTAIATTTSQIATVTASYGAGTSAQATVTFQPVVLTLTASPATIGADGQSTSTITLILTQDGAPLPSATVTIATTTGTLSATTATTNGAGQATVTLTAPASSSNGTATVTGTYRGVQATTDVTLEGVALALGASPGTIGADGQSTSTITLTLTRNGAPVSGASITLATTAGTVSPTTVTTNGSGQATTTLTAPVSGTNLTATVTGTYNGVSSTTAVTLQAVVVTLAASPATIVADGQSTSTITVTLTQGGSAVSGATVTVGTTAGTVSPTTVTTNASGQATTTLTAPASSGNGSATVTATYKGASGATTITLQDVVLTVTASPTTIAADDAASSTITVTLTQGGSAVSGATVTVGTTAGTVSPTTVTTNASGQATTTLTAATSKSTTSTTITASFAGVSATTTVTFTGIAIPDVLELRVVSGNGKATAYVTPQPSAAYFAGAMLLRRAAGSPQAPTDGVALAAGDTLADGSVVVAKGATIAVEDTGLTNGVKYYYRAFGYYADTLYSTAGVLVDAIPSAGGAGQAQWSVNSSTPGLSEPVVDGAGSVYWNGTAGGIVATDAATGVELWPPALPGSPIDGSVVLTEIQGLGGAYAVVGTRSGTVAAIDAATGTTLWETIPLGDAISANVAMQVWSASDGTFQAQVSGDLLIVGTKNADLTTNKVYGIDATTGTVLWTWNRGGVDQVTGWPWVDHATNRVIVTTRSNFGTQPSLWVLSTLNGGLVKSWSVGDIDGWLTYGMDYVAYVPASDGKLYALDLATWAMKWAAPFDAGAAIAGSVWEDWNLRGKLFFSTQDGNVWAVQSSGGASTPTLLWKTAVVGASAPLVLADSGLLYVGAGDGKLHELRVTDGVDQKQATLGDGAAAAGVPAWDYASGWVYAATAAGKVFAIPAPLP